MLLGEIAGLVSCSNIPTYVRYGAVQPSRRGIKKRWERRTHRDQASQSHEPSSKKQLKTTGMPIGEGRKGHEARRIYHRQLIKELHTISSQLSFSGDGVCGRATHTC